MSPRVAVILGAGMLSDYSSGDPTLALPVGELLSEVAAEAENVAAITATTLAMTRLRLDDDSKAVDRLHHLADLCVVLPMDQPFAYADILLTFGRDNGGGWYLDDAHDVLAAFTYDTIVFNDAASCRLIEEKFPGIQTITP